MAACLGGMIKDTTCVTSRDSVESYCWHISSNRGCSYTLGVVEDRKNDVTLVVELITIEHIFSVLDMQVTVVTFI